LGFWLDTLAALLPKSVTLERSESGVGKESPLSVFSSPSFRPAVAWSTTERRKGKWLMNAEIQDMKITTLLLLALMVACFGLLPQVQAVNPAPDGCYGNFTTAEGCNALAGLGAGAGNTGVGWYALFSAGDSSFSTGVGGGALALNNADSNTAVGAAALLLNTSGLENVAVGTDALVFNGSGSADSAVGAFALFNNIGTSNTAIGDRALFTNSSGDSNTAVGHAALMGNSTGHSNIAIGYQALISNDTGSGNIGIGSAAGNNVVTANGVICIGNVAGADVDNRTYIANIPATTVSGGGTDTVTVNLSTGLLGHLSSSRRYKEEVQPMNKASETLYRLKPVTYRFKKEIDATQSLDYGLVAEEVAEVDPNLAIRDGKGQIESVRYTAINAMLLNEFLKEHKKVEQLEKQVATLTAGLQKVSVQLATASRSEGGLALTKPAPQTVLNDH
jgi:hypothetical protein